MSSQETGNKAQGSEVHKADTHTQLWWCGRRTMWVCCERLMRREEQVRGKRWLQGHLLDGRIIAVKWMCMGQERGDWWEGQRKNKQKQDKGRHCYISLLVNLQLRFSKTKHTHRKIENRAETITRLFHWENWQLFWSSFKSFFMQ